MTHPDAAPHPASAEAARTIIETLRARGVTEAVLAPGSRSAPLAYALWERRDMIRLHVRIDERSAGFTALGLAKATGRLVPVITTSGTAVGNLLPAVMEAWHSRVPLLVISADRPATLADSGANQTTDQSQILGVHVRGRGRISSADRAARAWAYATDRLIQLALGSRGSMPGPTHLDVQFGEPLTPGPDSPTVGAVRLPALSPRSIPAPTPVLLGPSPVVVAGDLSPAAGRRVAVLAAAAGVPLLAEPSSNARHGASTVSTARLLLQTELAQRVGQVVMVGRPTLSRPVQRLLARPDVELIIVAEDPEWIDPGHRAAQVVSALEFAGAVEDAWLGAWQRADRRVLDALTDEGGALMTARLVVEAQGADDALVLGPSNPIRDVDLARFTTAPAVYANRGLAGIDGVVSTAVAVALARPQGSTTALLGDLTFLHDSNGMIIGPDEPRPRRLRLVVVNDDGGSIFATLEHHDHADSFERLFATPHHADLGALSRAVGIGHRRLTEHDELVEALGRPPEGIEVVEMITDRAGRAAQESRRRELAHLCVRATA